MFCINSFHQSVTAATHLDQENMNSCLINKSRLDEQNFMYRLLFKDMY